MENQILMTEIVGIVNKNVRRALKQTVVNTEIDVQTQIRQRIKNVQYIIRAGLSNPDYTNFDQVNERILKSIDQIVERNFFKEEDVIEARSKLVFH